MNVCPARVEDAPEMGRVVVETFLVAHRHHMPEPLWLNRKRRWTPEVSARSWDRILREGWPGHCLFVAEDAGIVGVGYGRRIGMVGEIGALYISPNSQRTGAGRGLFGAVVAEMKSWGVTSIRVGVLKLNLPARAFYEAMGGRLSGERPFDEDGVEITEVVYTWPGTPPPN